MSGNPFKSCIKCNKGFNLFAWRHKCKRCELIFCSECLEHKERIPSMGYDEPVPVCQACYFLVSVENRQWQNLSRIPTRVLKDYLRSYEVDVSTCLEKRDLVALSQQARSTLLSEPSPLSRSPTPRVAPSQRRHTVSAPPSVASSASVDARNTDRQRRDRSSDSGDRNHNSTSPSPPTYQSPCPPVFQSVPPPQTSSPTQHQQHPRHVPPSAPPPAKEGSEDTDVSGAVVEEWMQVIEGLSVRELKRLLVCEARVDVSQCVEKSELRGLLKDYARTNRRELKRMSRLFTSPTADRSTNDDENANLCKVCMDNPINCVILECGHLCVCMTCGKQCSMCPICRSSIRRLVQTFKS
eukprot:TRINITY_DN6692_c0_g1_i1.p1 TRINITY_DN6692_c0_g1~~TRINITY_DN6692_c0_g1_i1.p1  ORF type:complete len:353 (+),score=21.89 TRINITY_DN6692_c0_g1_i1:126-1184(+)